MEKYRKMKIQVWWNYNYETGGKVYESESEDDFNKPERNPDGTIMTAK